MSVFGDRIIPNKNFYGRLGRLVKLYGKHRVFFSILESVRDNMDNKTLLNFVDYHCRRKVENDLNNRPFNDLTATIDKIRKEMDERTKE